MANYSLNYNQLYNNFIKFYNCKITNIFFAMFVKKKLYKKKLSTYIFASIAEMFIISVVLMFVLVQFNDVIHLSISSTNINYVKHYDYKNYLTVSHEDIF